MITISNLSKNYASKVLFENINLSINKKEKIGLVGPNGAGKSTLFLLILKETEPSSGSVQLSKNMRIGYLPQEAKFSSVHTVLSEITEGERTIMSLKKEKDEIEHKNQADSARYGEILRDLEALGYFELEHKAKKILAGLGFKEADFNKPINHMSGGWQMRTLLAKLLVHSYDLLLLDEPTNYLDLNAALWFKDFLGDYDGTFIIISHDKAFLNEVTNYTLVLDNGAIAKVSGNYEHYQQIKEEKKTFLLKQFKEQEKKREQLKAFISRFHAQPNKAASVRAKRRVLENMEEISVPQDTRESIKNFVFPQTRRSGHSVIRLEKISKSYPGTQVYKDFDFEIVQGEKAVLVGENGAGKSTLLKILSGVSGIDSGERILGHNVSVGYFSQTRTDVLSPENTVLQEAYCAKAGSFMSEELIRTILGAFLFTGDDADKKVKVLSGGEKSRLILAKLLVNPPNFLLLDEPTTHLDVDAVDALIKALTNYEGTIVFISHDIHFVRSVANVVYEVKDGRVRKFYGNFDYYLQKKSEFQPSSDNLNPADKIPKDKYQIDIQKQKKLQQEKALKEFQRKKSSTNKMLSSQISKLFQEKEVIQEESYAKSRALSNSHIYRDEETAKQYGRRLKEIEKRLAEIEEEVKKLKSQIL